jgi:hypothetical protein
MVLELFWELMEEIMFEKGYGVGDSCTFCICT